MVSAIPVSLATTNQLDIASVVQQAVVIVTCLGSAQHAKMGITWVMMRVLAM